MTRPRFGERTGLFLATAALVAGVGIARTGAQDLSPETIRARQHYFGLDNVDPDTGEIRRDRVILSWIGVSSFAAAFSGHVVIMDAYVARSGGYEGAIWPGMAYVGTTPDELAALKPDLVLFGHSHFDHAGDLPRVIRANPGVTVAGAAEHCNDIRAAVADVAFTCISVFAEGAGYGARMELTDLLPGLEMTAVKQPHSNTTTVSDSNPAFPWRQTPCPAHEQYPAGGDPLAWGMPNSGPPSGSIAAMWQFRIGDFALVWQDTAGPIAGTGVPEALSQLEPTDVRLASIVVAARDVLNEHTALLRPKLFIPIHHDPCGYAMKQEVDQQLATIPDDIRPMMWFLADPADYLRPISFDPEADIWRD